jgi:hypothetical protein
MRSPAETVYPSDRLSAHFENCLLTDDKECLLGEHSPVNRMSVKPKALAREEIEEQGLKAATRVA